MLKQDVWPEYRVLGSDMLCTVGPGGGVSSYCCKIEGTVFG